MASNIVATYSNIKFCGYLRKKRNKVGGWRKLWFVLQDRLLVSYTSMEEYNNKLTSFRDLLNLVPGTQIRPMEGCRFTIETVGQTIYTFHCNDFKNYREWISKLLESLVMAPASSGSTRFRCLPVRNNFDSQLVIGAEPNAPVHANKNNTEQKVVHQPTDCLYDSRFRNATVKRQTAKQHIERLNITGVNEFRLTVSPLAIEKRRQSKVITTKIHEEAFIQKSQPMDAMHGMTTSNTETDQRNEPVYAVVDLQNKYVQRKKRLSALEGKRCNSYESVFQTVIEEEEPLEENSTEAIYEDGDAYLAKTAGLQNLPQTEENIYEPINIGQQAAAFKLRKYITSLSLNPFLRQSKSGKTDSTCSNTSKSRFSTLRLKFGSHRKSVQRRIRKFYGTGYEPDPLFQNTPTTAGIKVTPSTQNINKKSEKVHVNKKFQSSTLKNQMDQQNAKYSDAVKAPTKNFDSLPHLRRAVARISLLNNSPFHKIKRQKSKNIVSNDCEEVIE